MHSRPVMLHRSVLHQNVSFRILFALALIIFTNSFALPAFAQKVTVDWNTTHQTIAGWGASTGYQGCEPNCPVQQFSASQAATFWSSSSGVGLEWVHSYATSDNSIPDLPWLQAAVSHGAQVLVTMSCPPAKYISNNAFCSKKATLLYANYAAYAAYIVNAVKTYQTSGAPVAVLGIQNEPEEVGDTWTGCPAGTVAGCLATFVANYLGPAFASSGLTTQITLAEDGGWFNHDYVTTCMKDVTCAQYVPIIASHDYDGADATWGFTGTKSYCCAAPTL